MQHTLAKQYLPLAGVPILERTLQTLLQVKAVAIVVALAEEDRYFDQLTSSHHPKIQRVTGGATRAASVLAALQLLAAKAHPEDWVMVHDAARPLVSLSDIEHLQQRLIDHPVGGILATPVTDTIKQVDAQGNIQLTLARHTLWRALTPQLCRFGLLQQALSHCLHHQLEITDEAMALECCGHSPAIVEGSASNIKITYPMDLLIAEQGIKAGYSF